LGRHGRIIPQKHSKDRKMEGRKMFTPLCGARCYTMSIALMIPNGRSQTPFFCLSFFCLCFCSSQLNIVRLLSSGKFHSFKNLALHLAPAANGGVFLIFLSFAVEERAS